MQTKDIHPLGTLRDGYRLMRKLNLTPADALRLLVEVLGDLDRQIDDHEDEIRDRAFLPLPVWLYGLHKGPFSSPITPRGNYKHTRHGTP